MPMLVAVPLLILLFAASAFPWLLALRARFGHMLAIPATAGGALLLLLATLTVSHAVNANYMASLVVASVVVGALGTLVAFRTPRVLRRPGRYSVALWVPSLLGGVVWSATVLVAQVLPGASRFGWVMNGDALNNLGFADVIVRDNGIPLDLSTYSVPLSTALIATGLGSGSPSSGSASAVLEHHLAALTLVWVIMLVALCVAVGVVCASLIPPRLTRTVAVVSALGSLLPLTWFVTGLIVQWGYFNVDVVLPIALAAWLTYLASNRHPVAALICLVGFAILAFAAWTPIAILVMGLGVALVVRHAREFRAIPRWPLVALIVIVAAGIVFALRMIDFSGLFSVNGELSVSGAGYTGFVNLWWGVPIVAGLAIVALLLVRRRTSMPTTSGLVGILVGSAITGALLVYLARRHDEFFGAYYPKKYAWILLVLLGTILLSFLIGAFAGRVRASLLAAIVLLALVAAAVLPPGTWPEVLQRQPVVRILGDYVRHDGEATVREILALTTSKHSTVLWQSGDPDQPIVNEWLLLSHGGLAAGNAKLILAVGTPYLFYRLSGRYVDRGVATLCKILPLLHGKPVVVTASPSMQSQLRATCPGTPVTVVVTTTLIGTLPTRTGENWQTDGIEGPFD